MISGKKEVPEGLGVSMKTVSKREICDRIAGKRPDLKKYEITDVVTLFMECVSNAIVKGERVELRDFGIFASKERKGRTARNPRTGDPVEVPTSLVCTFKVGKELKDRLADTYKPNDAANQ